jgi:signal transduction histidine kinase
LLKKIGRRIDCFTLAFAEQSASDAAHELRAPVSVMLTQTQTALNRERSPAEYRETLEACQRERRRHCFSPPGAGAGA